MEQIYKIKNVSGNNNECYYNCLIEIFKNEKNHEFFTEEEKKELKEIFNDSTSIKNEIKIIIKNNNFVKYYDTIFLDYANIYKNNYNDAKEDEDYIKKFSEDDKTKDVFNIEGYEIILEQIKKNKDLIINNTDIDDSKKETIVKDILIELCSRNNVMVTEYIVSIIKKILLKYKIYVINMQTSFPKINEKGEYIYVNFNKITLDLYKNIIKNKYSNNFYTLNKKKKLDKQYIDHIINNIYNSLASTNYDIQNVNEIKYIVTFNDTLHYNYLYIDDYSIFKIFDINRFKNKQEENVKTNELIREESEEEYNDKIKKALDESLKEEQRQKKSDINFTIIANGGYNNKYIDNNCSKYNRKIYNKDGKEYVIYKYQKILLQKYKQKIQEIKKKEKVSSSKSITSAKKKEKVSSSKNK